MPASPDISLERCPRCGASVAEHARSGFCSQCLAAVSLAEGEAAPASEDELAAVLPRTALTTGTRTRFGDYELLEEIARGGMGVVYRARQRSLNRIVAIKTRLFGGFAGEEGLRRFRLEAASASALEHPNIVRILDVGEHDGQPFLAMDYVAGRDLARLVIERPLLARQAAGYVEKIARAVEFAHQRGVLHRDLKSSNILIDAFDEPRVTDFGLAKRLERGCPQPQHVGNGSARGRLDAVGKTDAAAAEDSRAPGPFDLQPSTQDPLNSLTRTGQPLGSPGFMPPEQAEGDWRRIGPASDVYGLGAILYHLLTSRPPFLADTFEATLRQVLDRDPIPLRQFNPNVPADLETICLKCLEKEPAKRYATAQALADELGRFLRDEPIHARPVGSVEKAWRWCRRKPALAGLGVASFLLLVAAFTGIALVGLRNAAVRKAEQREYFAGITLADNYVRIGDIQRALEVLTNCPPAHRHWEWGRLMFLCHQEISTLDAIPNKLAPIGGGIDYLHAIVSADRSRLVTVSEDGTATAWALPAGTKQFTAGGPGRRIVDMAFGPDGRTLALLDRDGAVQTWDAVEGRSLLDFPSDRRPARSIRFSPDGARLQVAAIQGATVFDARTGQRVATTPALPGDITRFALSADATLLATLDEKGKAQLWDAVTGEVQRTFDGMFAANGRLLFSPNGRRLLIGDPGDGTSSIWNTETGERQCELKTRVEFADFSPDGSRVCVLSGDNVPRVWSTGSGREILALKGHVTTVRYAAFSSDGLQVTTVDEDYAVKIWRSGLGRENIRSNSLNEGLVFSPDGKRLALTQDDDDTTVWDVESGAQLLRLQGHLHRTMKVAFSPDGKRLYTGSHDKTVKIWNLETGVPEQTLRGHSSGVVTLALSPDGRTLATAADGVRLWDLASGAPPRLLAGNTNSHYIVLAFRPDGRQLASAYGPEGTYLWDPRAGTQLRKLAGHSDVVMSIAYSPDGRTLVTAGFDKQIHFWDPDTGRKLRTLRAHLKVYAIHFSPDGRRLITSTGEHRQNFARSTAQIWDVESGRELLILDGHASTIYCATFSPDGRRAATVDWTGVVRIWETFPWQISEYPGDPAQPIGERARLYANAYWKHRFAVDAWTSRAATNLPAALRRRIDRAEFAARPPGASARQLDLTEHYNALLNVGWIPVRFLDVMSSDLSRLPTGLVQFAGTTFDVRGLIQVQGSLNPWLNHRVRPLPELVAGIPVGQPVTRLHALLGAIGREPDGTLIGAFRLHYPDGTTQEIPIHYGEHVRDWWSGEDASETLSHGSVVWQGTTAISQWRGGGMRVFATRWDVQRPGAEVTQIDFVSKLTRSGPFLIALTIDP